MATTEVPTAANSTEERPIGFGNLRRDSENTRGDAAQPPQGNAEPLARAWLEVNCAMCHRPEGIAAVEIDLRFRTSNAKLNLLGKPPKQRRVHPPAARLVSGFAEVVTGQLHKSTILGRLIKSQAQRVQPADHSPSILSP